MFSLIKYAYRNSNLIPATTVAEELPVAIDATLEIDVAVAANHGVPLADVPTAKVSGPILTLFGRLQKYCKDISEEVFFSTGEYNQQERVKELARKYSTMNVIEQLELRSRFENFLKEAIENVANADNPSEVMQSAARSGALDLVKYKENLVKELKVAKREFKTIFGQHELDKFLASIPGQSPSERATVRYS